MDKKKFLEILKDQLEGQMPEGMIAGHIQYYRDYIDDALKHGKSEDTVLSELGDPRLIAKTLVGTAAEPERFSSGDESSENNYDTGYGSPHGRSRRLRKLDLSTWWGKAVVILAAAAVLALMFVALSVILPLFALGCVIIYLISHFKKK